LKGNNTREFWCYEIALDTWIELPRLPDWTAGIRFGSGIVWIPNRDTSKVFCLKGSGTTDFLVYWVKQNEWHSRRPVPRGIYDKPVRRGSALTVAGKRIFVLKGWTNEFYEYVIDRDSWRLCSPLPLGLNGRMKKCRNGAALTSDHTRYIYAFKGGKTTEFWRYDLSADTWEQLEDIPLGNRWHRVNSGGALAFLAGAVYALKGGGSREFWRYDIEPVLVFSPPQAPGSENPALYVHCNGDLKKLNYNPEPAVIFDPSGRRRYLDRLEPGVYFVITTDRAENRCPVRKVIIYR
jgi:outer membrane protein assembly factor BamB